MPAMKRNEVHVCPAPNGHVLSTDCWCEPAAIYWVRNRHGVDVLVVEHDDVTLAHRIVVTAARERDRDESYANDPNNGWITRVLDPRGRPVPSEPKRWLVARCECRVCGHAHISVYPEDIQEEENQECPRCRGMTAEPVEWFGPRDLNFKHCDGSSQQPREDM